MFFQTAYKLSISVYFLTRIHIFIQHKNVCFRKKNTLAQKSLNQISLSQLVYMFSNLPFERQPQKWSKHTQTIHQLFDHFLGLTRKG